MFSQVQRFCAPPHGLFTDHEAGRPARKCVHGSKNGHGVTSISSSQNKNTLRRQRVLMRSCCLGLSSPFSAAPKMSPNDAPESDEPYCSTASFSSAISRALIDTPNLRVFNRCLSHVRRFYHRLRTLWTLPARSRDRSERRMNVFMPSYSTSMPPSSIAVTSTVITEPRFTPPVASANLSPPNA